MSKTFLSLVFSVIIARWLYSEAKIVCPALIPAIDYAITRLEIPTHDKWPEDSIERLMHGAHNLTTVLTKAIVKSENKNQATNI